MQLPGKRPRKQPVLLMVTLLIAQALPSGHGVPPAAHLLASFQVFLMKNVVFFVNDEYDPFRYKTQ